MSAGSQNNTQWKQTNKTISDVSWFWDSGYKWVKDNLPACHSWCLWHWQIFHGANMNVLLVIFVSDLKITNSVFVASSCEIIMKVLQNWRPRMWIYMNKLSRVFWKHCDNTTSGLCRLLVPCFNLALQYICAAYGRDWFVGHNLILKHYLRWYCISLYWFKNKYYDENCFRFFCFAFLSLIMIWLFTDLNVTVVGLVHLCVTFQSITKHVTLVFS